ncbi:hypothetical protein ACAG25_01215 [Mycobacterium sp. pV006]|uniref:hypothetical protein n=1 Tax=Mycobacterium sp. pV006 TaxID=3238983 RepID=UPI00351AF60C
MGLTLAERAAVAEAMMCGPTQRQIHALTAKLFTLAIDKAGHTDEPQVNKRAQLREVTKTPTRAFRHEATGASGMLLHR